MSYPPPSQPYGQYPPSPYPAPAGGGSSGGKTALIVVLTVVLTCGLVLAIPIMGFVWFANEVKDSTRTDYRGGRDNPITVAEGEAFTIRDLSYGEGWQVSPIPNEAAAIGAPGIDNLKVTSNRDDLETYLRITFEFSRDGVILGSLGCTPVVDTLRPDASTQMECDTAIEGMVNYDEIRVYDNSWGE